MLNERLMDYLVPPPQQTEKKVLYLSGLAASGKTTVASILQERLNAHLVSEFPESIPDYVMDTRVSSSEEQKVEAQQWVIYQYVQKNDVVSTLNGNIVVDRTWIDALIYSQIYGESVLNVISQEAEKYKWNPGLYVLLYADEIVIKQRLHEKFGLSESDWQESWKPYIHDLRQSVIDLAVESGILAIDTSALSPVQVSEIIEDKFRKTFE